VLRGQHRAMQANQSRASGLNRRYEPTFFNRGNEPQQAYFRCGRFFTVGHEWYATVREGRTLGPFVTKDQAQMNLACFVTDRFVGSNGHIGQLDAHGGREATTLEILVQELSSCREQARLRGENCAFIWAQQRLEDFEKDPGAVGDAEIRGAALRHFLFELDA